MDDAGQGREMVIIANHTAGQADLPGSGIPTVVPELFSSDLSDCLARNPTQQSKSMQHGFSIHLPHLAPPW
jgi:hypothetical protein